MLNQRTQVSPTFKSRYRYLEYPKLPHRPRTGGNTIGSGGSIVSALGTENTSFATGWPMRRPIAKSENGWSTGLAKCITSESSVGAVENQNGSDPIPGDEPVLARFGEAHEIPWADAEPTAYAATCLRGCVVSGSVDEAWEHPRTFRKQDRNAAPLPDADRGSQAWRSRQGRLCRLPSCVALLMPEFLRRLGLSPQAKVLDLRMRVRCRGCGAKGRAVVSIRWRRQIA
jgi:hypothetical protein